MVPSVAVVNMCMVYIYFYNGPSPIICGIISPIVWRMPYCIIRSPEITVNNRNSYINRRKDVIRTINIRVTYKLYNDRIVL